MEALQHGGWGIFLETLQRLLEEQSQQLQSNIIDSRIMAMEAKIAALGGQLERQLAECTWALEKATEAAASKQEGDKEEEEADQIPDGYTRSPRVLRSPRPGGSGDPSLWPLRSPRSPRTSPRNVRASPRSPGARHPQASSSGSAASSSGQQGEKTDAEK